MITREIVRKKLLAYLNHSVSLAELVDWAETTLLHGELDQQDAAVLRDVLARLGLADVREFGLSWEDCTELLGRLGYVLQVSAVPA